MLARAYSGTGTIHTGKLFENGSFATNLSPVPVGTMFTLMVFLAPLRGGGGGGDAAVGLGGLRRSIMVPVAVAVAENSCCIEALKKIPC